MVQSTPLNHQSVQHTTLMAQMFPSHVILGTYWVEAAPVLVMAVDFGIPPPPTCFKEGNETIKYFDTY